MGKHTWPDRLGLMSAAVLVCACGCAATPFTGEGIASVLEQATPIILKLAEQITEGPMGGSTDVRDGGAAGDVNITVVIINPARDVWRFPLGHLLHFDCSQEALFLVVPGHQAVRLRTKGTVPP